MSGNTIAEKILADHSISNRSVKPGDIINAKVDLIMSHFGTAKVVVDFMVDEKTVVIGSTNWTFNALTANHESSVVFESKDTALQLIEFFEKIRKKGKKL